MFITRHLYYTKDAVNAIRDACVSRLVSLCRPCIRFNEFNLRICLTRELTTLGDITAPMTTVAANASRRKREKREASV